MERDNKSLRTKVAEISQKFDVATSGVALVGSVVGLVPIGFTVAFLGFNAVTYIGAEMMKQKKKY